LYRKNREPQKIVNLLTTLRPFFSVIPQAKTGKIVRTLINDVSEIEGAEKMAVDLCRENIEWAVREKRTFLLLALQTKLAQCLFQIQDYQAALDLIKSLARELKKLDDKMQLVSIFLLESKIHHALHHLPRCKASLTAARTAANAIYCPPLIQAELDLQSGVQHAEEKDYKTAYSYFYEAYENYETVGVKEESKAKSRDKAILCLKYMLLTRIIDGTPDDVAALLGGKLALEYTDEKLSSMRAIAKAHQQSSLGDLKEAIEQYKEELEKDPVIHNHLKQLYQNLMEDNLLKIILPFSQVEISHVAKLISLNVETVEKKLSQMILDKKLKGILDQGNDCLIVFDDPVSDSAYPVALDVISNLGVVVDSLYNRASRLK